VNEKKDGYNTAIWIVSTASGESRQLTNSVRDSSPRWSPDGKYLLFVRSAEKDGRPEPAQLYMLSMAGGESFQFTTLPRGAGQPQWSPDGTMISFMNSATPEELAKAKEKPSPSPSPSPAAKPDEKRDSDVRVITRSVYRSNGAGYVDNKHPQHIWVINTPRSGDDKVTPRQLTSGRYDEASAIWAKDNTRIYFTSDQRDESFDIPKTDIYSVGVAGDQPEKLTSFDMGAGNFSMSPDGKRIAFVGSVDQSKRSYSQPDLWVIDVASNAKPRNLTADYDFDVSSGVGGDNTAPRGGGGNQLVWSPDGKAIMVIVGKEGRANLARFDSSTGKETDVTTGDRALVSFRTTTDNSKFVYLISTPTKIGDLFFAGRPGAEPKQITRVNVELFSKLNLTEPDEVWYQSFDGKRIHAWIQKPPDFDPNKKYPLILNIHGGPHAAYGFVFDHEFQWMAAKGYVVLYPNPRGSTTYGQDFGNIIQYHYPGDDYKDLMAGVDEVIKRGYIDTTKLGVTGGSGGGLLTNWTIGQTDRFAAAVSQRDIADWADWWYTADFTLFQQSWFRAAPFEDPEDFKARSPLTYIKNVKTPLMLILGEADYRTPPTSGGEEMFRALKYRKIPTVMVRFPNESHELSRSGQPWHRIERLQHIVGWFDHWLIGMPKPEYELGQ
jgi:dipeptidyl aminopeptidase/acylaminoacyl peptidase